jgi:hypothetical protein
MVNLDKLLNQLNDKKYSYKGNNTALLVSKPFKNVNFSFVPDNSPETKFPVTKCGNTLMVSSDMSMSPAVMRVQFGAENTMVLANAKGNLIGRLLSEQMDEKLVKYYTMRQYDLIQVADTVKFQAVKGENDIYRVRLKGFDLGGEGSESWFTLAMRVSSHCGKDEKTSELVFIPEGLDNPDFIPGKLAITFKLTTIGNLDVDDEYDPKPYPYPIDENKKEKCCGMWAIIGISIIVLLGLLFVFLAIFLSCKAYRKSPIGESLQMSSPVQYSEL